MDGLHVVIAGILELSAVAQSEHRENHQDQRYRQHGPAPPVHEVSPASHHTTPLTGAPSISRATARRGSIRTASVDVALQAFTANAEESRLRRSGRRQGRGSMTTLSEPPVGIELTPITHFAAAS